MFASEWEAAVGASGLQFGRMRTRVASAMFYYTTHFMADQIISAVD